MQVITWLPIKVSESLITMAKQPKMFYHLSTYYRDHICQFLDDSLLTERRHDVSSPGTSMRWQMVRKKTTLLLLKKSCFHLDAPICKSPEKRIWNQTETTHSLPQNSVFTKKSLRKINRSEATTYNWLLSCHSVNTASGWRESQLKDFLSKENWK